VQEKLAETHEKLEQLEMEKADAAWLAALRGRAAEAQSAALRAAEMAHSRKRAALVQALVASETLELALAQSRAERRADNAKVCFI